MQLKSIYKVLATTFILGQTMVTPIMSHADTVPTNAESHTKQQSNMNAMLGNLPFINFASDVEDFGKKSKEETTSYVDKRMKEQEGKMSSSEISDLQDLIKNNGIIKEKEKGDKLDNLFNKLKTEQTIKVISKLPMKEQDAKGLKGKLIPRPNYTVFPFKETSGSDPLMEITVPKGSHVAYGKQGNDDTLIIERGTLLEITDVSQVTDKGISRIKIEAKLISSEEVRKREEKLDETNKKLSLYMGLPVKLASIKLDPTNDITRTEDVIEGFRNEFDELFMSGIFSKADAGVEILHRLETNGVNIKIGDIGAKPEDNGGLYRPQTKEIFIDLSQPDVKSVLAHELGHAIDHEFFKLQLGKDIELVKAFSKDKELFAKEFGFDFDKLYAGQSEERKVQEFFAEAFAKFVMDNQKLKKVSPDTYEKIKQILSNLIH
ncbi:hypothetical protein BK708_25290 [Bacillus thuringiensis serovar yunnanensis]|nr:hypothetical protein BK708_25290 [Bacillus thuringiensis serovar yunnanensis]